MKELRKEAIITVAKNLTMKCPESMGTLLLHMMIKLYPWKWLKAWAKRKNVFVLEDFADLYRMELLDNEANPVAAVRESANLLFLLADGQLTEESAKTLMLTRGNMQLDQHLLPTRDYKKTINLERAVLV